MRESSTDYTAGLLPATTQQQPTRTWRGLAGILLGLFVLVPFLQSLDLLLSTQSLEPTTKFSQGKPIPMANRLSYAVDSALDISDAYLRLGAAFDRADASSSPQRPVLLNNDHEEQRPAAMAIAMYNRSLEAHDYAATLANWLATLAGRYRPDWSRPSKWADPDPNASSGDLLAAASRLDGALAALEERLLDDCVAAEDWPTLSFLRLAKHSSLHDPAPEKLPSAADLADLPDYRQQCSALDPPLADADSQPPCAEGSSLPLLEGESAAAAVALVHSLVHSSRVAFAFANRLDASSTALKGFEQWFSWRSRSDRANAMSLLHYVSARGLVFAPPSEPYDASPVHELTSAEHVTDGGKAFELALALEERKAGLISAWYSAAARGQSDGQCAGGADRGACGFLMSPGLRWLRSGDSEDEPEWRESLLVSQARKVEDMRKILTILTMARTPSKAGVNGFGDYYTDHQLPDTVP